MGPYAFLSLDQTFPAFDVLPSEQLFNQNYFVLYFFLKPKEFNIEFDFDSLVQKNTTLRLVS